MKQEMIRIAYLETAVNVEHGSFEVEHPVAKANRRIRLRVRGGKPDL
jgi:DNA-directed RNA polymerase subunit L